MSEAIVELWEILVPVADNDGHQFNVGYHQHWDQHVLDITGGLTLMRTAKGQWYDAHGQLYSERVIPVRIACNEDQIKQIMRFTKAFYDQIDVLAYRVSDKVLFLSMFEDS